MTDSIYEETAGERRLLCGIAFVCYSVTVASLVAVGYSLAVLALGAAGQQIAVIYTRAGM